MDSKTKKIAMACFIGGVFFTAIAFWVAPAFWWLGMLAGFVGGYLGYEFRETLRVVPVAWRTARTGSKVVSSGVAEIVSALKGFLLKPHPFGYLSLFLTIILCGLTISNEWITLTERAKSSAFGAAMLRTTLFSLLWGGLMAVINLIASLGGATVPLSYRKGFYYLGRGAGQIIIFFTWIIWKGLAIVLWRSLKFVGHFLWEIFIIIHRRERLLCALDGTLGGMVAFLWLAPTAETLAAKAAVVVFGGILGAGFGVVNYEFVSKKWLKLVPQT